MGLEGIARSTSHLTLGVGEPGVPFPSTLVAPRSLGARHLSTAQAGDLRGPAGMVDQMNVSYAQSLDAEADGCEGGLVGLMISSAQAGVQD